jgi:hypothetical protein
MTPGFGKPREELPWLYYPESNRVIINAHNFGGGYDSDAAAYIAAVETADGASLATKYKDAIDDFIVGAKVDGFWTAIKAACFLAGPATLDGALVPLVGTAPTRVNFVSGDYTRGTGLKGDGLSKYLNANRSGNSDPQNDCSMGVWLADTRNTLDQRYISSTFNVKTILGRSTAGCRVRANNSTLRSLGTGAESSGLIGFSRSLSTEYAWRYCSESGTDVAASNSTTSAGTTVFVSPALNDYSSSRLAFYWIGESLSLTNLSSRLATYMAAIA